MYHMSTFMKNFCIPFVLSYLGIGLLTMVSVGEMTLYGIKYLKKRREIGTESKPHAKT